MRKLLILPDEKGYSIQEPGSALSVQLGGPATAYRSTYESGSRRVALSWSVNAIEYRYLQAFFRTGTAEGSERFLVDLILDDAGLTQHIAAFDPGTWSLAGVRGGLYQVRASVEVRPAEVV